MILFTEKNRYRFKIAFIFALLLHIVLGLFFFGKLTTPLYGHDKSQQTTRAKPAREQKDDNVLAVIKARAVDSTAVAAQVKAIKARRRATLTRQQKQLRRAKAAVRASNAAQHRAQSSLATIKKQQLLANKKLKESRRLQQQIDQKNKQSQMALKKQQVLLAQSKSKVESQRRLAASKAKRAAAVAAEQAKQQQEAKQRQIRGIMSQYKSRILAAIASRWIVPANIDKNLACQLLIRLSPVGTVLSVDLIRSSGNPLLDRSARLAVFKASPLPVPKDAEILIQFKELMLTVRPEDIVRAQRES